MMEINAFDISASGMRAQRRRMDLISANLANVDTTSVRRSQEIGPDGRIWTRHDPFRRRMAVFMQGDPATGDRVFGVSTPTVVEDDAPLRAEHDPGHPHAIPEWSGEPDAGTVYHPNVNPITEMVDMIAASRAYEANVSAIDAAKAMRSASLRILA